MSTTAVPSEQVFSAEEEKQLVATLETSVKKLLSQSMLLRSVNQHLQSQLEEAATTSASGAAPAPQQQQPATTAELTRLEHETMTQRQVINLLTAKVRDLEEQLESAQSRSLNGSFAAPALSSSFSSASPNAAASAAAAAAAASSPGGANQQEQEQEQQQRQKQKQQQQIEELQTALKEARKSKAAGAAQLKMLSAQLEQRTLERDSARADSTALESEVETLRQRLLIAETERQIARGDAESLGREKERAVARLGQLSAELASAKAELNSKAHAEQQSEKEKLELSMRVVKLEETEKEKEIAVAEKERLREMWCEVNDDRDRMHEERQILELRLQQQRDQQRRLEILQEKREAEARMLKEMEKSDKCVLQ